jgi:single-stranded-DNA-specific exonuclease
MLDIKDFKNDLVDNLLALGDKDNNPFNEQQHDNIVSFFKKIIKPIIQGKKIAIVGDYDVDGFFSAIALETYLKIIESRVTNLENEATNINMFFSTRSDGYTMPKSKFDKLSKEHDFIIFLDTGSEYEYLEDLDNVAIIDHHPQTAENSSTRKNLLNPNLNGELSTSTGRVVYEMAKIFDKELQNFFGRSVVKNHIGLDYIKMLTSVTVLSDMAELDYSNREFLKKGIDIINENRNNFLFLGKISDKEISAETLSFNLINIINSYSRMNNSLEDIAPLFQVNVDSNGINHKSSKVEQELVYKKMLEVHTERKRLTTILEEKLLDGIALDKANPKAIHVANLGKNNEYSGINGLLAQFASNTLGKPSLVMSWDKQRNCFVASARGRGVKSAIANVVKENQLGLHYGGHTMACGVSGDERDIDVLISSLPHQTVDIELEEDALVHNYESDSIKDYKKACDDYLNLCDTVGISDRFYCTISDYEYLGSAQTKNGWGFVTIHDSEDYLSFYCKSNFLSDIEKGSELKFEIKNSSEDSIKFLDSLRNIKQKENDNTVKQKGLEV